VGGQHLLELGHGRDGRFVVATDATGRRRSS